MSKIFFSPNSLDNMYNRRIIKSMKYVILFIVGALLYAPLAAALSPIGALVALFILGLIIGSKK